MAEPHSKEVLLEARIFTVERRFEADREGQPHERFVVVHPGAVVVLPVLDDGRVILIRNERFAVGKALWEFPAGTLEPGEEPSLCAGRELEEETGYRAAHVRPLGRFYTSPGFCTEVLHVFEASNLVPTKQDLDPTERISVHPFARVDVETLITQGEIEDAKSLATWLLWSR